MCGRPDCGREWMLSCKAIAAAVDMGNSEDGRDFGEAAEWCAVLCMGNFGVADTASADSEYSGSWSCCNQTLGIWVVCIDRIDLAEVKLRSRQVFWRLLNRRGCNYLLHRTGKCRLVPALRHSAKKLTSICAVSTGDMAKAFLGDCSSCRDCFSGWYPDRN